MIALYVTEVGVLNCHATVEPQQTFPLQFDGAVQTYITQNFRSSPFKVEDSASFLLINGDPQFDRRSIVHVVDGVKILACMLLSHRAEEIADCLFRVCSDADRIRLRWSERTYTLGRVAVQRTGSCTPGRYPARTPQSTDG